MRIIVIGCREKWDWAALDKTAVYLKSIRNREELAAALVLRKTLDHYDMAKKPRKGDAYEALVEHKDTAAVVACHLYGLDEKKGPKYARVNNFTDEGYRYTKHNHKFLNLCLKRNIPFIVVGDQPIDEDANVPDNIIRHTISTAWRPIYMYERAYVFHPKKCIDGKPHQSIMGSEFCLGCGEPL
jgi:hypothetical protein